MDRSLFSEEHESFRKAFRQFVEREITPHQARWRDQGQVDREVWRKAGAQGFLCTWMEEKYGGPGADFLCATIIMEELAFAYESGFAMGLHSDIIVPYLYTFGTEEQKQRWLPGCASGEIVTALGMTEPGTGSDLAALATTAIRDGDDYVINGQKTFISNGQLCDLVVVAAKTDPTADKAHKAISMFVVEANRKGFVKGKRLHKMGMASQDTSELFFEDLRLPASNLLGEEGRGFEYMMTELPQERLLIALTAVAMAEAALEWTLDYTRQRQAFGRPLAEFQTNRFKLAEMKTEIQIGRVFLDRCLELHLEGKLDVETAAMAKYWLTELEGRVIDQCLQMHGGYGYMLEYPIARAFADARVHRIYGGSNEIMRELVARHL